MTLSKDQARMLGVVVAYLIFMAFVVLASWVSVEILELPLVKAVAFITALCLLGIALAMKRYKLV